MDGLNVTLYYIVSFMKWCLNITPVKSIIFFFFYLLQGHKTKDQLAGIPASEKERIPLRQEAEVADMGPRSGAPHGVYDSKNDMKQTNGHSVLDGKPHAYEFELESTDGDHRCGFGACRPGWIQICNNAKFLLVLLSAFSFIQSE